VPTERAGTITQRRLLTAIESGVYPPGTRLPGERVLSEQLQVSRSTLRGALQRLAETGAVANSAQRGWFVPRPVVGEPPSTLQSFTEMALARNLRPSATVLSHVVRPADLDESSRLGVAPASPVLELVRLRGMDRTPICVDTAVLPLPLAAPLVDADLTDRSLYAALRDDCAVRIHRSAYSVVAEEASGRVAELLAVASGWPVLVGTETTYAHSGEPVNLGHAVYRGDAYRFQADLFRPQD